MSLTVLLLLLATVAWIALYILVIRPKLRAYRYTAGIYARLDGLEAGWRARAVLWLKGLKVMIAGVITSAVPLAPVIYDKISGVDWTAIFSTEKAKAIAVVVTILGVVGPMIMVALHSFGLAEAAATEPTK